MEDGFAAVCGGEPGGAIAGHRLLHRVDTELLTHVGLVTFTQLTLPTFSVEYWDNVVSFF